MIRRIEIENFMSLKNVGVDLTPLTVFVGENGSGKSAIFKALVALSKLLGGLPLRGARKEFELARVSLDDLVWAGDDNLTMKFRVWFEDSGNEPGHTVELTKTRQGWGVSREEIRHGGTHLVVDDDHPFIFATEDGPRDLKAPLRACLRYFVNWHVNDSVAQPSVAPILEATNRFGQAFRYRPSASDISSFVPYPAARTPTTYRRKQNEKRKQFVAENGRGLAFELQDIQGANPEIFDQIQQAVSRVFPHVEGIRIESSTSGVRLAYKTTRRPQLVPAPNESDGVLLATFLLWRMYTGHVELKVCLEEPENGLHPLLLAERFGLLKAFTQPNSNPRVQLLVATHSPEFLHAVKTRSGALFSEIRLTEFSAATGTSVRHPKVQEVHNLFDQHLVEMQRRWGPVVAEWPSK